MTTPDTPHCPHCRQHQQNYGSLLCRVEQLERAVEEQAWDMAKARLYAVQTQLLILRVLDELDWWIFGGDDGSAGWWRFAGRILAPTGEEETSDESS